MDKTPSRYPVTCAIDGRTINGHYWVAGKILVVATAKGGGSARLGAHAPEDLARRLLVALAHQGKA